MESNGLIPSQFCAPQFIPSRMYQQFSQQSGAARWHGCCRTFRDEISNPNKLAPCWRSKNRAPGWLLIARFLLKWMRPFLNDLPCAVAFTVCQIFPCAVNALQRCFPFLSTSPSPTIQRPTLFSLQRHELRVLAHHTSTAVLDGLVGDGELTQVVANHLLRYRQCQKPLI